MILMSSSMPDKNVKRVSEADSAYYFQKPSGLEAFMELGGLVLEVTATNDRVGELS